MSRHGPTDQEIKKWVLRHHGFEPDMGWIIHCRELFGLALAGSNPNAEPCPLEKMIAITQAFRHFGLLTHHDDQASKSA